MATNPSQPLNLILKQSGNTDLIATCSLSDDPRSGLVDVFPTGRLLPLPGLRFRSLLLLWHAPMIAQLKGQRREAYISNCTTTGISLPPQSFQRGDFTRLLRVRCRGQLAPFDTLVPHPTSDRAGKLLLPLYRIGRERCAQRLVRHSKNP